jgi:hypothetical protein
MVNLLDEPERLVFDEAAPRVTRQLVLGGDPPCLKNESCGPRVGVAAMPCGVMRRRILDRRHLQITGELRSELPAALARRRTR